MRGAPPQPADQRKTDDKMPGYFVRLEATYSPALVKMVAWCLEMDALARPQSLFALQKELAASPPPVVEPKGLDRLGGQFRGLVDRLGGLGRKKANEKT